MSTTEPTATVTVQLSAEECAVLAAVLAPTGEDINIGGINSVAWGRLQDELFPVELFRAWVAQHGHPDDEHEGTEEGIGYDPEAGW